jgi:hypothetical protein
MGNNKLGMKGIIIFISVLFLTASSVMYQAIRHDTTMTGEGTTASPLKVDTSMIATPYDVVARSRGGTISPAQITADQDDYDPTDWDDATIVRLSTDSDMQGITSFAAPDDTYSQYEKTLINIGSYTIYIPMDHPDGTATNRVTGHSGDFKLYPGKSAKILYDVTSTKWRVLDAENENGRTGAYYFYSNGSATGADWGDWAFDLVSSGAFNWGASTTTLPAYLTLSSQSSTTGGAYFYPAKTVQTFSAFGLAHTFFEATFHLPNLSDGTDTYLAEVQIIPTPTSSTIEVNNMFGVRYSHSVNSGKFELFSQDNVAGESVADLGVTVAANTLYKVRIEVDKSKTEARAYINDVYCGKVTGTLPNSVAVGARCMLLKSAGATARSMRITQASAGAIYK